jgi:hypothetical protein
MTNPNSLFPDNPEKRRTGFWKKVKLAENEADEPSHSLFCGFEYP